MFSSSFSALYVHDQGVCHIISSQYIVYSILGEGSKTTFCEFLFKESHFRINDPIESQKPPSPVRPNMCSILEDH